MKSLDAIFMLSKQTSGLMAEETCIISYMNLILSFERVDEHIFRVGWLLSSDMAVLVQVEIQEFTIGKICLVKKDCRGLIR